MEGSPFLFIYKTGDDLLSHTASGAVSSALKVFTSVFGMGTGVTPSLKSPVNLYSSGFGKEGKNKFPRYDFENG